MSELGYPERVAGSTTLSSRLDGETSPGLPWKGHGNPDFIRDALSRDKGAANQMIRRG
jgi:hypothetical protein